MWRPFTSGSPVSGRPVLNPQSNTLIRSCDLVSVIRKRVKRKGKVTHMNLLKTFASEALFSFCNGWWLHLLCNGGDSAKELQSKSSFSVFEVIRKALRWWNTSRDSSVFLKWGCMRYLCIVSLLSFAEGDHLCHFYSYISPDACSVRLCSVTCVLPLASLRCVSAPSQLRQSAALCSKYARLLLLPDDGAQRRNSANQTQTQQ